MRIRIYSDLHLEHSYPGQYFNPGSGELLILAGDILCAHHLKKNGYLNEIYRKFIRECSENYDNVLYVKGNHEYYSYNYEGADKVLREALPDNFHLLDNETIKIGDVCFLGFTMWTDFFNENPIEMMDAQMYMNDYKSIRIGANYRKLNTNDVIEFHRTSRAYLEQQLEALKNERVFVISHHAPSPQCIASAYKNFRCNGAFCSNLDELILNNQNLQNWVFGHVHTCFDFNIGQCRLVANPRGYNHESTGFNNQKIIEI
jgi:Icc-related predicted phosphoesterase